MKCCARLLMPAALALGFVPQALGEPTLPAIYAGYAAARRQGTLPKTLSLSEESAGVVEQAAVDAQGIFLKFVPQEAERLNKFNTFRAVTWARGNFDLDSAQEVLISLTAKQVVASYSDVEFPVAPAYQIIFIADTDSGGIRTDSVVPVVLNVTRDTDIDCGNCTGLQTRFALVVTQDFNNDGILELVLQKETVFRKHTAVLDETQLYARATRGWLPVRQDAPVQSEREPSE